MNGLFEMGGYGAFVWSAYGLCLAVLVGNIVWAKAQRKKMLKKMETFFLRLDI